MLRVFPPWSVRLDIGERALLERYGTGRLQLQGFILGAPVLDGVNTLYPELSALQRLHPRLS